MIFIYIGVGVRVPGVTQPLHQCMRRCNHESSNRSMRPPADLIRTSVLTKDSGSMKITTHLDHISHCKIILVIIWYKLVEQMDPPSILSKYSPRLDSRECIGATAVERIWHILDSQGQILAMAFRVKSLIRTFQVVPSSLGSSQSTLHADASRLY